MLAKERRSRIAELLKTNGSVETAQLAERFCVSAETIRKDLLALERGGEITRTHGGAVAGESMKPFHGFASRCLERGEEKREIARKAMELVSEGDVIGVGEGSTAVAFAEELKACFSALTVVTYSLDVFQILCDHRDFTVILCGGLYMRSERAFYGVQALDTLSSLRVGKAFLFPTAISLDGGLCGYRNEIVEMKRQLIRSAEQVVVLADSSKLEKHALLKICALNRDFLYLTDHLVSGEIRKSYREKGVRLITAGETI